MSCDCVTDQDWCVDRYAGDSVIFTFTNNDNSVRDLTGFAFKFVIRSTGDVVAFTLTIGSGITVDLVNGIVECALSAVQSATLDPSTQYYADLRVVPPTGQPWYVPVRFAICLNTPNSRA